MRHFVRDMKSRSAIVAWDVGNECNCLGEATRSEAWTWLYEITSAIRLEDPSRPVVGGMHSLERGGIVDWLFGMFGSGKGKKADREKEMQRAPSVLAEKCPVPRKRELSLEEGNGETATRMLAILASGERSRSELASELGIASQPWLYRAYLNPLMAQGYIAQTLPKKPRSPLRRYRLLRKGWNVLV